jgi:hypothetical protein
MEVSLRVDRKPQSREGAVRVRSKGRRIEAKLFDGDRQVSNKKSLLLGLLLCFLLTCSLIGIADLHAQPAPAGDSATNQNPLPSNPSPSVGQQVQGLVTQGLSSTAQDPIFRTTLAILIFGGLCLLIQFILLWRARASPEDVMRNVTVTVVVTFSICALNAGFAIDRISPTLGLFGTIIGFLLGQKVGEESERSRRRDRDAGVAASDLTKDVA